MSSAAPPQFSSITTTVICARSQGKPLERAGLTTPLFAAARDGYTGEVRTGESGAVPTDVNQRLLPGLRQAQEMQANGTHLEEWDPGICAEFHACNNVMNEFGAHLDEIEFGTVRKDDGSPFPSCGWCRHILIGGGATERTPR